MLHLKVTLLLTAIASTAAAAAADDSINNGNNSAAIASPPPTIDATMFNTLDGVATGSAALAVVAMLGGIAIAIAGYKLLRASVFALGFALGGTVLAIATERICTSASYEHTATWIAFLTGGLVTGAIAASVYIAGLFLAGAAAGAVVAAFVHTSVLYRMAPDAPDVVLLVVTLILSVLCGLLTQRLGRATLIGATSLVGAALAVWGVGYFAGNYPSAAGLTHYRTVDTYALPHAWWGYLCATLVLAVGSALLQTKLTARGVHYRNNSFRSQRESSSAYQELTSEERRTSTATSTTLSTAAIPRRKVVVIARRDALLCDAEVDARTRAARAAASTTTSTTPAQDNGYAIV